MGTQTVNITAKAKSKSFRLFNQRQLKEKVEQRDGDIYRKGGSNEYHLSTDDYVIVVVVNGDILTVVTQMHHHVNYPQDKLYEKVEDYGK